jgi:hypothetical protein
MGALPLNKTKAEITPIGVTPQKSLTQRQLLAIQLFSQGNLWPEIWKQVGVSKVTGFNWRKNSQFMSAADFARKNYLADCIEKAKDSAQILGPQVIECLQRVLKGKGGPAVRAALALGDRLGILMKPEPKTEDEITVEFGEISPDKEPAAESA